jgi:hypothetical protein
MQRVEPRAEVLGFDGPRTGICNKIIEILSHTAIG